MYNDYGSDCGARSPSTISIGQGRSIGTDRAGSLKGLGFASCCSQRVSRYLHTSYTGRCWCDAEGVISRLPQMVEGREDAKSGSEKLDSELSRGQTSRIKHFPVPGFYRERSGLLRYLFVCRSRVFTPNFALNGRGFHHFL
jgi:hypothetical protein